MLVVEFIGCPGVGKSSVFNPVMDSVRSKGFSVENIHRSEMRVNKFYRKWITFESQISSKNSGLKSAISSFTECVDDPKSLVWTKDLLNASFKLNSGKINKLDYAFFEEGPTQYISSIAHQKNIKDMNAKLLIDAVNESIYSHDTIAFYVEADLEDIVSRLVKRGKTNDRYILNDADAMMEQLVVKKDNIEYLIERLNYKAIHRIKNDDLDQAINKAKSIMDGYTEV